MEEVLKYMLISKHCQGAYLAQRLRTSSALEDSHSLTKLEGGNKKSTWTNKLRLKLKNITFAIPSPKEPFLAL